MRLFWYYSTMWPICGWNYRTLHVWWTPRDILGVGRVYGVLAYDSPLLDKGMLEEFGLVPVRGGGFSTNESPKKSVEAREEAAFVRT
jgi:hypothetical protein